MQSEIVFNRCSKTIPNSPYSYSTDAILGRGAYGAVYRGIDINTKDYIAVKCIQKSKNISDQILKTIEHEMKFFARKDIKHDNIVNCLGAFQDNQNYYLITEYCEGGDLEEYLQKKKDFLELEVIDIMADIFNGYSYLNSLGYMHRDLKLQNIIIKNGKYKICDFGSSKDNLMDTELSMAPGTPHYMSPEMLKGEASDYRTDIWSLGIIFFKLLYSKLPFMNVNETQLFKEIEGKCQNIENIFPKNKNISKEAKILIKRMLEIDVNKRITLEDIAKSSLFTNNFSGDFMKLTKRNFEGFIPTTPNNNNNLDDKPKNSKIKIYRKESTKLNEITPSSQIGISIISVKNIDEKDSQQNSVIMQIELKKEGFKIIRTRLKFEQECIILMNKMIDVTMTLSENYKASFPLNKYIKIIFPLAKIACLKYTLIIKPMAERNVNTIDVSDEQWDIMREDSDVLKFISEIKEKVKDMQEKYPRLYANLKIRLLDNPFEEPLNKIDQKFSDLFNNDFKKDTEDQILNFLESVIAHAKNLYQQEKSLIINAKEYENSLNSLVSIVKSRNFNEIEDFYRTYSFINNPNTYQSNAINLIMDYVPR